MMIAKMPDGKPEIYLAVQGEGKTIGKPMIFTRMSMCNLNCTWCDTYYTWNFDDVKRKNPHRSAPMVNREEYILQMSINDVVSTIYNLPTHNVNFTGGEPTIQQKDLLEVIRLLRSFDRNYYFETETNGTLLFNKDYLEALNQINCSPKLKSSGNLDQARDRPAVIKQIKESGKAIFKFVVTQDNHTSDIMEIKQWQESNDIPNDIVYLMPEGTEKQKIIDGTRFLIDKFACQGYSISTRLQIICYDNKRAV